MQNLLTLNCTKVQNTALALIVSQVHPLIANTKLFNITEVKSVIGKSFGADASLKQLKATKQAICLQKKEGESLTAFTNKLCKYFTQALSPVIGFDTDLFTLFSNRAKVIDGISLFNYEGMQVVIEDVMITALKALHPKESPHGPYRYQRIYNDIIAICNSGKTRFAIEAAKLESLKVIGKTGDHDNNGFTMSWDIV